MILVPQDLFLVFFAKRGGKSTMTLPPHVSLSQKPILVIVHVTNSNLPLDDGSCPTISHREIAGTLGWYPINTHYIRCIWGLRVPSQGYHHFPYEYQIREPFQTNTSCIQDKPAAKRSFK